MLVLKIAATLALFAGAIEGLDRFCRHFENKFGAEAWPMGTICLWQLYAGLMYAGWLWMAAAAKAHGDVLNGLLVTGLGLFGAGCILVNNYRRASPIYAAAATVLQLVLAVVLFPPLSLAGLIGANEHYRPPGGAQRQRRDDNKAGLSGYRPMR
jgi:hypothetical protein